jgi:AcrR family transcriptional regulator
MTEQHQRAQARQQGGGRREQRAQRILDVAAALILRWGYNKTTIDDIARQAGVAKGTIYLHWKTREGLFAALMLRERLALAEDFRQRLLGDPSGATLRGMLKHSALALMQRPLLKAALLRDMEVIGKLAHSERSADMLAERLMGFTTYLEFLRQRDLVRTDLDLRVQVYILGAIFMGFFLLAPLMPDDWTLADEELADVMAETVHRALEPQRAISPDELQTAAQAFMQYVNRDLAMIQEQLQDESAS